MGSVKHICCLALLAFLLQPLGAAFADIEAQPGPNPGLPSVVVHGTTTTSGEGEASGDVTVHPAGLATVDYEWLLACAENAPGEAMVDCAAAGNCADAGASQWTLWAQQITDENGEPTPDAQWEPIATECYAAQPPAPAADPGPQVTDALVLEAVRRLGLPRLEVQVQPSDDTLVNLETIFFAEPLKWQRTVDLLGFVVDVEAEPVSYDWHYGDGESKSSTDPGAPYPATDITHVYSEAGVVVRPRVDVAYQVRYRVDGGEWQSVAETVPAAGVPVALRIREATALLVGQ